MFKPALPLRLPLEHFDRSVLPVSIQSSKGAVLEVAVLLYFRELYARQGAVVAVALVEGTVHVDELTTVASVIEAGVKLAEARQFAQAISLLEGQDKRTPGNPALLFNLGMAYSESGDFGQAVIKLHRAVQFDPGHAHAWSALGVAYHRLGKPDSAFDPLRTAANLAPQDADCQRNFASALLARGRVREALARFREVLAILENDPVSLYGAGTCLMRIDAPGNKVEAEFFFGRAIQVAPESDAAELCRTALSLMAASAMRAQVGGGLRPDVMMYLAGALDKLATMSLEEKQTLAFEAAYLGREGLDVHSPERKYSLQCLEGKFSGLHLLALMYAAFKDIQPSLDVGIDFSAEYAAAHAFRRKGNAARP